jgi:phosphoheptose isomerase
MVEKYFKSINDVISKMSYGNYYHTINRIASIIYICHKAGGKILIAGNGGSCSQADHFAGELTCTFKNEREGIAAISLSNTPALTAWSNDFSFDTYLARQVSALGRSGDILFLLSTGGGNQENNISINVVKAALTAKARGIKVFSLIGKSGGELKTLSDEYIIVPSDNTAHIQEAHLACIHAICSLLDSMITGDK